jgi:hypothetical protein
MSMYPYNPNLGNKIQGEDGVDPVDRAFLMRYAITPDAASASAVLAATALTDAAQTITANITSPDVPRIVTIKGNAADNAGDVVVTGTNMAGETITDTIALSGTDEVEGAKAFKTVTSIALPAETHEGTDTVSVGIGNEFGVPKILSSATKLLLKLFNNAADSGTLTVDDDELEKNLFAINGTPDGSKVLELFLIV